MTKSATALTVTTFLCALAAAQTQLPPPATSGQLPPATSGQLPPNQAPPNMSPNPGYVSNQLPQGQSPVSGYGPQMFSPQAWPFGMTSQRMQPNDGLSFGAQPQSVGADGLPQRFSPAAFPFRTSLFGNPNTGGQQGAASPAYDGGLAGINPFGNNPYGANPAGSNPYAGINPFGPYGTTNPASSNPYGSNPYGATNPASSNPYGTINPANSNPYGVANPANSNPYGVANPANNVANPANSNPYDTTNPANSNPYGTTNPYNGPSRQVGPLPDSVWPQPQPQLQPQTIAGSGPNRPNTAAADPDNNRMPHSGPGPFDQNVDHGVKPSSAAKPPNSYNRMTPARPAGSQAGGAQPHAFAPGTHPNGLDQTLADPYNREAPPTGLDTSDEKPEKVEPNLQKEAKAPAFAYHPLGDHGKATRIQL